MTANPALEDVEIDDIFLSSFFVDGKCIGYISTVKRIEDISKRFNKPDRIIYVDVAAASGNIIDHNKPLWHSQLIQGLV